jgi:hypothetical protein
MSFHDMMLKGLGVEKHGNANELMKKPPKERTVPKIHDFEPNATHQMDLVYLTHDQVKKTRTGNSRQVALAEYLNYIIGRYVALYQHSKEEETGVTNREWVSKLPTIISNYNKWVKSKQ